MTVTGIDRDINWAVLRDWERDMRARGLSRNTIDTNLIGIRQLAVHAAAARSAPAIDLLALDRSQIQDWIIHLNETGMPATANRRARSAKAFYGWAVTEDYTGADPMTGLRAPAARRQSGPIPRVEDLRKLLAACAGRDHDGLRDTAIIRLFCEPGAPRISAMANLLVASIDLDTDVVWVDDKGGKRRAVPFGDKTGKAITKYLRARGRQRGAAAARVWLGPRGPLTRSGIYQMVARRCGEAGVAHLHPHQFRRYATHLWLKNGGSIDDAMRLFGWSSPQMPMHYAGELADERAAATHKRLALGDQL